MKKAFIFMLCLVLCIGLIGCGEKPTQSTDDTPTTTTTATTTTTITTATTTNASSNLSESLADKLAREMDTAYETERNMPENQSTGGLVDVSIKYAEKWAEIADEYYQKIMEYDGVDPSSAEYYSSNDLHTYVADLKTSWESYYAAQCDNYSKTLYAIYGGSIVGPIFADMQKEWALWLVNIYQQM